MSGAVVQVVVLVVGGLLLAGILALLRGGVKTRDTVRDNTAAILELAKSHDNHVAEAMHYRAGIERRMRSLERWRERGGRH